MVNKGLKTPDCLRSILREETGKTHDALEERMAALDLTDRLDYARFLKIQLEARQRIEDWFDAGAGGDFVPPKLTTLIFSDLYALGERTTASAAPKPSSERATLPGDCDPLGVAWVVAGSVMGNRTILARLKKAGAGSLPTAFLADDTMVSFWHRVRDELERPANPAEIAPLVRAAKLTFGLFDSVARSNLDRIPA